MRKLKDWLDGYIDYTSEQESPSLFHLWVGLTVISAALERRVWLDKGYYKLYPNLYVVLIAGSARCRKSTAIGIGERMLRDAFPSCWIISQKITAEALIGVLAQRYKKEGVSGAVLISDELSVTIGSSSQADAIVKLLTKLYDCGDFDYHTIIRGKEVCRNPYFVMIGGTTPIWLKQSIPESAIGGGFTSRVVFVYQDRPEKLVPFPSVSEEGRRLREWLVHDLVEIGKMKGEFVLSDEAKEWYEEWYTEVFKPEMVASPGLDGYYGRKHDTLLKVAMCVSASRKDELVIGEDDLRVALKAMNTNEKFLPQTVRLVQMSEEGEDVVRVLRRIERKGVIDHSSLLRAVSYRMNARRLQEVIDTLVEEERIEEFIKGGKRWYKAR